MGRSLMQEYKWSNRGSRLSVLLLAALLLALSLVLGTSTRPAAAAGWWNNDWRYRTLITVDANGYVRQDKPVEVYLNFTPLLADQGGSGALDPNSIRVIEIDNADDVIDADIPFQLDKAGDYHASNKARGTLVFLLKGTTAANETRRFHVYFETTGGGFSAPSFNDLVQLTDGVSHKEYSSLRLVTADAEYFYHKLGGGFATLFDKNNNDWIDWNTAAGGAGDFRGIPNMVHPNDGGFFHPGRNSVTTTVLSDGPLKVTFKSVSKGGAWEIRWDVFPTYARMTVVRKGPSNFWWLYEGTPGGVLEPGIDRLTRSNGDSIPASGTWNNDIPGDEWIFVTDPNVGRSLYLIHHQEDTKVDGYAIDAGNNMTIFGFGRGGNQRYLSGLPQEFTLGFVDQTGINGVRPVVNGAYKPLTITGSNDDGGGGVDPGPVCDPQSYSILVSPKGTVTVDGVKHADEDVLKYDGATCEWSKIFDGTDAGLPASANVDALAVYDGDLYLSFAAPVKKVPGLSGTVDDSDVVKYSSGTFSMYFDGSIYGLTTSAEDVDAIAFDGSGKLIVSTTGAYSVDGLPKGQDEDLLRLNGAVWELYFDGSSENLGPENIAGVDVAANGDLYLSVLDAFNVPGANGNAADIFICRPSGPGYPTTGCVYSLYWDSVDFGLKSFDAFDIE